MIEKYNNNRHEVLRKVSEYYKNEFLDKNDFIKGVTNISYAGRVFDENEMLNLVDSALEFWLTYGKYSSEFESKLKKFLGVKHCLLVNSGSSANLLAFMSLTSPLLENRRVKRGDEVITVAAGFPTTIAPIIQCGAVPVFVDVELETYNIDVNQLKQSLSEKTKAVILAHTLGNPFNIKKVKEFCEQNQLWLIEDNCDSLGAKYAGRYTGTWGDIGTSSFYPPHHITTGEGGAVYTNNNLLRKIMLSMRDWGRDCWCDGGKDNTCGRRFSQQFGSLPYGYDHKYVYSHFGYNLKATEMQAAIGCAQMDKLPGFINARQNNFDLLYSGLRKYEEFFILPKATEDSLPSWFGFILTLRENTGFSRNDIVRHLEENKIQTRNLFGGNMLRQPCFTHLENQSYRQIGSLPNTDKIMNDSFWIGVFPGMTDAMVDYMIDTLTSFFEK